VREREPEHAPILVAPDSKAEFDGVRRRSMKGRMRPGGFTAVVIASAVLTSSCGDRNPTEPTETRAPSVPATVPVPPAPQPPAPQPLQLTLTGVVTDDEGRPIPNARLTRWFGFYEQQSVSTDASGKYKLQFSASRGSEVGPPGAENAVAFVTAEAPGYEYTSHYILAPTDEVAQDFRMYPFQTITAGESRQVTIAPDDSVCGWDWSPGRETTCRFVRLSVPTGGVLTVEVVPLDPASKIAWVDVWNRSGLGSSSNPAVLTVPADAVVSVAVAVKWGATVNQSFVVKSSFVSPSLGVRHGMAGKGP
jgi:hypothetical protein